MLFGKARDMLTKEFSRLKGVLVSTASVATIIASLSFSAAAHAENPITAQPVAATPSLSAGERGLDAVQGRHDMEDYSNDTSIRGIGIFINLQNGASVKDGEHLGEILRNAFKGQGVSVDYRINQSRGTATAVTFYVRGVDYTMTAGKIKSNLTHILARHNGAWLTESASLTPAIAPEQT